MSFFSKLALLCCLLPLAVFSKPTPYILPKRTSSDENAPSSAAEDGTICGQIVDAANQGYQIFLASDAFACLTSVPFNDAVALRFIDYYNTTLQFHSTVAYLKNPPEGYQQPAVDVFGGLESLKQNVTSGYYKNQYAFEVDLQRLVYSMHDGHVDLSAGVLSAFSFSSGFYVSSASVNGKQLPQIYLTSDIIESQAEGWEPYPIVTINKQNATEYLTEFAALNSVGGLEPHADWNQLMGSPAQDIQGNINIFGGGGTFYPGDTLNVTLANGTEFDTYWLAFYDNPDYTGPLTTGGDFYNYFVLGLLPASYNETLPSSGDDSSSDSSSNTDEGGASPLPTEPGETSWFEDSSGAYPDDPAIVQEDLSVTGGGVITGYFLDDISTGVLSIPTFEQSGWDIGNFTASVGDFITQAQDKNVSKVVIDLQQNLGGAILLAINTFKQFFPQMDPWAGSRRRDSDLANILGSAMTQWWDSLNTTDDTGSYYYFQYAANEWVVTNRINAATGKLFVSWEEFFGPRKDNGDNFSLNERYNLSDTDFDSAAFDTWIPYGYDQGDELPAYPPWQAEDIVILTDGLCSSACALFVEMMTEQAGVKTVTVGGRPTQGPMQAVSGSRGALAYDADTLDGDFGFAQSINDTANTLLPQVRDSGIFTNFAGFNLRDQIRENDIVPLQFKYLAADCRIYYTLANVYNMSRLWRDTATAAWHDTSLCVAGSTGYASSGKSTATYSPPAPPQIHVPASSSLDWNNDAPAGVNDTQNGGLQDPSGQNTRDITIRLCKSNGGCDFGRCRQVPVSCKDKSRMLVNACLPSCLNRSECGANAQCSLNMRQETKSKGFGTNIKTPGGSVGPKSYSGFCVPIVGTRDLGCPR